MLDLSHVIAGPACTRLLADLGADVIKVESRAGDMMRTLPIVYEDGLSTAFSQFNCGKRSIGLDLKHPDGLDLARRLISWADVVVENFRPGALDRLGLDWDEIHEVNPRVILLSISLFGRTGPYSSIAGFGTTPEAYSGLMALAGAALGVPAAGFGTPLADMTAGVHALAVLGAALHRRQRSGAGCLVDISSFDCIFSMVSEAFGQAEYTGGAPFRSYGSCIVTAGDGRHVILAFPAEGWRKVVHAMERDDLLTDERFVHLDDRIAHRNELNALDP